MQCPLCKQIGSRKHWSDSQWILSNPIANGHVGCKHCRALPLPAVPTPLQVDIHADLIQHLGKYLHYGRKVSSGLAKFMHFWMDNTAADYRKSISHLGAIRCAETTHPCHWDCPLLGRMFDPGNAVYSIVITTAVPELKKADWNVETHGDIVECMLAVGLRNKAPAAAQHIAAWLEACAGALYSVMAYFPQIQTGKDLAQLGNRAHQRLQDMQLEEVMLSVD
jgi:hypothetical protein